VGERVTAVRFLLAMALMLATAAPSRADVGIIVLEPIGPLGFFTRVGHAGTYFSNICPDGSPIRMRLCKPGERGGVVSKYAPLIENEDYDWAIVPFDAFLHGLGTTELAPLIATPRLQQAIHAFDFGPLFSRALTRTTEDAVPDGEWKSALATRFERALYLFTVETTAADDATIVAAFNAAPNKSRFNFFYRNCSDQTKRIFDLIMPAIGDRTGGMTMETPKGMAKALVSRGIEHPELHLRAYLYPQLPGSFPRSRDVLFPMENMYRSLAMAPWWFFGGFREVAIGAMFYHEVLSRFDIRRSYRDFMSPSAARLTIEQAQLRRRQDQIGVALAATHDDDVRRARLSALNVRVSRRLAEIRAEKRIDERRTVGATAHWQELGRGFAPIVRRLGEQPWLADVLRQRFAAYTPDGALSADLLQFFDADGDFRVDEDGAWITLAMPDGTTASTGLSAAQVLAGDPRVAALVLAAVIDHNLSQGEAYREDIAQVDRIFSLFAQAVRAIAPLAPGAGGP
jgi:hypothetical protein